jgi:hypothetical protein
MSPNPIQPPNDDPEIAPQKSPMVPPERESPEVSPQPSPDATPPGHSPEITPYTPDESPGSPPPKGPEA